MTHIGDAVTSERLGCPFCGATAHRGPTKMQGDQMHGEPFQRYRVWCPKGHASVEEMTEALAWAAWNRRHPSTDGGAVKLVWKQGEVRSASGDLYSVHQLSEHVWQTRFNGTEICRWRGNETEAQEEAQLHYDRTKALSLQPVTADGATHRHKKRGTEYVLIGIGKMQAEDWRNHLPWDADNQCYPEVSVDMAEVAIYRSATDPNEIWVRPREEFEDGRFEPLPTAPGATS